MKPIDLPSPVTYVTQPEFRQFGRVMQPEQTARITGVTLREIVDNPGERRVTARFLEPLPELVLWEGDAYDTQGDWTYQQAEARILEVLATP